ncbi:MAG: response regulator [Methanobacterium sp.]
MIDILIVEDESLTALELQKILKLEGYRVPSIVSSGEEAIKKVLELNPDIILMDIMLEGSINGIEAAKEIKRVINVPIIYLTAYGDKKTLQNAKITEPHAYILKPFEGKEVIYAIELGLQRHEMEMKLKKSLLKKDHILEKINDQIQNNQSELLDLIKEGSSKDDKPFEESKHSNIHHNEIQNKDPPDFALVDFALYAETLIEDLMNSNNLSQDSANINLNIDNLMLDLNTALSCGLIINELVNIFLKLNSNKNLNINIDFHIDEQNFILVVSGNQTLKAENSNYSEFKLVNTLVKQLGGSRINENNGSRIKIIFKK